MRKYTSKEVLKRSEKFAIHAEIYRGIANKNDIHSERLKRLADSLQYYRETNIGFKKDRT